MEINEFYRGVSINLSDIDNDLIKQYELDPRKEAYDAINLILDEDKHLKTIISLVRTASFESGELILNYNIMEGK